MNLQQLALDDFLCMSSIFDLLTDDEELSYYEAIHPQHLSTELFLDLAFIIQKENKCNR